MNILMIGGGQAKYAGARYYEYTAKLANGFVRNGHNVMRVFDKDLARMNNPFGLRKLGIRSANAQILEYVRDFQPDMILLKHAYTITNDTIDAMREIVPQAKIFQLNIDALFTVDNVKRIRDKAPLLDATFVTTGGKAMLDVACGKPVYFVPNIVDASVETGRAFDGHGEHDVFLAVGNADADPMRRQFIEALRARRDRYRLALYIAAERGIWGAEYMRAVAASKCGINLSRFSESGVIGHDDQFYMYSSDRLAHLVGNGVLTFSDRAFGLDHLFTDEEMVFYKDADDLLDKLDIYLGDDAARKRIAEAGWARAHRDYNERNVAAFMVDVARNGEPSETYPWPLR